MALINASRVTKAGAVILTTVSSFLITPPSIAVEGAEGVSWKNFATFFIGLMSIALYERYGRKKNNKILALLGLLFLLVLSYEALYLTYSITCNGKQFVISHGPMRADTPGAFEYWRNKPDPVGQFLTGCNCDAQKIWTLQQLAPPYIGLLLIYFTILLLVTYLLVLVSGNYVKAKKTKE